MSNTLDTLPTEYARHRMLGSKGAAEFCGYCEEYWRKLHREGKTPPAIRLTERKLGWPIGALVVVASRARCQSRLARNPP